MLVHAGILSLDVSSSNCGLGAMAHWQHSFDLHGSLKDWDVM